MHGVFFLNLLLKVELYMKVSVISVKLFVIAIDNTIVQSSIYDYPQWLPNLCHNYK